ncbi:PREDICTED: dynactin-associated protein [Calidris pugnax]|uniref:dynactin-associated protein n=1 Tax=Calidris pugnax TaxID=198806 RepID=UPI00071D6BC9|nr:PREDICTED: dynactin-associated protein [Calidris pugnax]XP_014795286.1 PREDICTED: dynactin-associated protein [Calidris pugnax]XP_014795287.1 PREDICTED: dynactin-associated protein [Calidris pugnax]
MDNQAFEMYGENIQKSSKGTEWPRKEERNSRWSLMKVFLVCLLACVITTVIGVLVLSLVYVNHVPFIRETVVKDDGTSSPKPEEKDVDIKFQFLNHVTNSKVHKYPGGEIQWARYRNDVNEYQSDEEMVFGRSINNHRSKMTFGTLRIKSNGLRAPHWHFNANEHGYLAQGSAWIGVIGADNSVVTTYNVTAGQVIFFPRNTVHWVKNVGSEDCLFLLFFTTHEELQTLDVDDAFFSTPEDVAARALKPQGGVNFIRTFKKQEEDQAINLPSNLNELVNNATYVQSPDNFVWQFFYDLKGSAEYPFPGGVFQWARYRINGTGLNEKEKIFSESLNKHENTLTLATLRIFSNGLGQPHFHFNANEMGYVISGCGQVGVILSGVTSNFNIGIGDVIFFPVGTQHYIKSVCDEDLLLILAYSTGNQLETLRMNDYFHGTADHILAQLFFKHQDEFKKFPRPAKK